MSHDEKAAKRMRKLLSRRRDVVEKELMGRLIFMVNGHMCCGLHHDTLMIRVGPQAYAAALAQPHARPAQLGSRRPTGFIHVDPAGYDADAALSEWLQRGLALVATLPPKQAPAAKPRNKRRA